MDKFQKMKKVYYRKLIRDGVVTKMQKLGVAFKTKKLSKKSYEKALLAKLEEEASGATRAKTKEELIDELVDILAVIEEVKQLKKIDGTTLRSAQKKNMKTKGGFSKRLWLIWSEDSGYKTNEKLGKAR